MAMDGDQLGIDIATAVAAAAVAAPTDRTALFKAIGNAVVAHIRAHADFVVTFPAPGPTNTVVAGVNPVAGVLTGHVTIT